MYYLGELTHARAHLEQCIVLCASQKRSVRATGDPGVISRSYAANVLWYLGYPDQALKRSQEALILARELSHPFSLAWALDTAAYLYQLRREGWAVRERVETLIALCSEQGFAQWLAEGSILRSWALAEQGQREDGIAQIHQDLAAWQAIGAELERPYWLALLAETCGKAGQAEEGLSALAEALALVEKNGDRVYEAELYRLKGTLTLQQANQKSKGKSQKAKIETDPRSLIPDPQFEAEACFFKAIEIARKQQAKSWELRAVMSLVRLRQQQAMQPVSRTTQHEAHSMLDEARTMLSEVYNWFTEGFDTKDLQEAKALLESLESGV